MLSTQKLSKEELTRNFLNSTDNSIKAYTEYFKSLLSYDWEVRGKVFNLSELGCSFEYNNRKRALGLCKYSHGRVVSISISKLLLKSNLDKKEVWDDIIKHEIAHGLDVLLSGTTSHGYNWKRMCLITGANPSRTTDGKGLIQNHKYELRCPNSECDSVIKYHRKPKSNKACGKCCKKYNNGRFTEKFSFELFKVA